MFLQLGAHHDGLWAGTLPILQLLPASPILSVAIGMESDVVDYSTNLNPNEPISMLPRIMSSLGPH